MAILDGLYAIHPREPRGIFCSSIIAPRTPGNEVYWNLLRKSKLISFLIGRSRTFDQSVSSIFCLVGKPPYWILTSEGSSNRLCSQADKYQLNLRFQLCWRGNWVPLHNTWSLLALLFIQPYLAFWGSNVKIIYWSCYFFGDARHKSIRHHVRHACN